MEPRAEKQKAAQGKVVKGMKSGLKGSFGSVRLTWTEQCEGG